MNDSPTSESPESPKKRQFRIITAADSPDEIIQQRREKEEIITKLLHDIRKIARDHSSSVVMQHRDYAREEKRKRNLRERRKLEESLRVQKLRNIKEIEKRNRRIQKQRIVNSKLKWMNKREKKHHLMAVKDLREKEKRLHKQKIQEDREKEMNLKRERVNRLKKDKISADALQDYVKLMNKQSALASSTKLDDNWEEELNELNRKIASLNLYKKKLSFAA